MTEQDYESIEAAVVETVRGRWFLSEFARRSRAGELREMLDAIGRLERLVTGGQAALPSSDTSLHTRLLGQRTQDISNRLHDLVEDLRDAGLEEVLCESLEAQARAVAGLARPPAVDSPPAPEQTKLAPPPLALDFPDVPGQDRRLTALAALDALSMPEKLALFA